MATQRRDLSLPAGSTAGEKDLHLILRFNDKKLGADTIAEHEAIVEQSGYVWWGKFGLGMSDKIADMLRERIDGGRNPIVYLASVTTRGGTKIVRAAKLRGIVRSNQRGAGILSPEKDNTPPYYRDKRCGIWLKLTDIESSSNDALSSLVHYNDPSRRPTLAGMQSLIYVTPKG